MTGNKSMVVYSFVEKGLQIQIVPRKHRKVSKSLQIFGMFI